MQIRAITDDLSVADQITPQDVAHIAAQGFAAIICNRPDCEAEDQPEFDAIAAQARAAGLEICHLPVVTSRISDEDVADFARAVATMPKPLLAYCRSGTRCAMLWSLSMAPKMGAEDILKATAAAGYDLRDLAPRLSHGGKVTDA